MRSLTHDEKVRVRERREAMMREQSEAAESVAQEESDVTIDDDQSRGSTPRAAVSDAPAGASQAGGAGAQEDSNVWGVMTSTPEVWMPRDSSHGRYTH